MWWFAIGFVAAGAWSGIPWVGLAVGAAAAWIDVQLHPITTCAWCHGDPKVRDIPGTSWRGCFWCGGTGKRGRVFARRRRDG